MNSYHFFQWEFFTNCYSELLNAILKELTKNFRETTSTSCSTSQKKYFEKFLFAFRFSFFKKSCGHLASSYDIPAENSLRKSRSSFALNPTIHEKYNYFHERSFLKVWTETFLLWTRRKQFLQPCELTLWKSREFVKKCSKHSNRQFFTPKYCFSSKVTRQSDRCFDKTAGNFPTKVRSFPINFSKKFWFCSTFLNESFLQTVPSDT